MSKVTTDGGASAVASNDAEQKAFSENNSTTPIGKEKSAKGSVQGDGVRPQIMPLEGKRKKMRRRVGGRLGFLLDYILPFLLHVVLSRVYLQPMSVTMENPSAVLDELHIMSHDNKDVLGTSTLKEVWTNDYWGRPMNGDSSHKSWRPLTVMTFRWWKGQAAAAASWGRGKLQELFVHRVVNVIIHSAAAEIVSLLSLRMFPHLYGTLEGYVMRYLVKILFALHPTHIEATANAANRPHIFALLLSLLTIDPASISIGAMFLAEMAALASSETAIFQLPPIVLTMTLIAWRNSKHQTTETTPLTSLGYTMIELIPRYVMLFLLGVGYLLGRHYLDWLSIPEGLIRPAENPFYNFQGLKRVLNYSMILAIHVAKSLFVDPVGFSHEYGYECLKEIPVPQKAQEDVWTTLSKVSDVRLLGPLFLLAVVLLTLLELRSLDAWVAAVTGLSWYITLFPVSGILKVGTFIADRLVVASTVGVCIFLGRFLSWWILSSPASSQQSQQNVTELQKQEEPRQRRRSTSVLRVAIKFFLLSLAMGALWLRVDRRIREWMDNIALLQSSLKTCPRSAKSNLEMSKVYSGLFPHMLNLKKAKAHITRAEQIDPNYCDVHQQFAHVLIQEGNYLEFEDHLTKAVMCPFSMGGAVPMWKQYWESVLHNPVTARDAQARMDKYQAIIYAAVEEEMEKERRKQEQSMLDEETG